MRSSGHIFFAVVFSVVWLSRAEALTPSLDRVEFRNTSFPTGYAAEGRDLELQGMSLLKYKHIFKLYTGALYLDPSESGALDERAKRFEVVYLRTLQGVDLVNAGAENLTAKYDMALLETLRDRLNKMNAWWMREFNSGDRAAITYLPGQGTFLEINGELQGVVEGEDFARVYFSIWLGPDEVSDEFKRDLLSIK